MNNVHADSQSSKEMMSQMAVSRLGMFHILAYAPHEGEAGVPVTVHTHFHNLHPTRRVFLRLVIGTKAIGTEIRRLGEGESETWRLEGAIPPFHIHKSSSPTVTVTVQAVDTENNVLDTITFGEFTYWSSEGTSAPAQPPEPLPSAIRVPAQRPTVNINYAQRREQSPIAPQSATHSRAPQPSSGGARTQQLLRRRDASDASDGRSERAVLEFVTPLDDAGKNFTQEERQAGRRLVRFTRKQDGHRLRVSCQPVRQEDYDERSVVISCIYRASTATTYVTSVDIIYLLQYFVQDHFSVEEKNRIRRNLEGFRPVTISKSRGGSETFFQQIMEFPTPKPRNIEKDVKVFTWDTLGAALDKIIAKYSLFTVTQSSAPSPTLSKRSAPDSVSASPSIGYSLPPPAPPAQELDLSQPLYQPASLSSYERAHYSDTPPDMAYSPPGTGVAGLGMDMNQSMIGVPSGSLAHATSRLISHGRISQSEGDPDGDLSGYHAQISHQGGGGGGGGEDLYHGPIEGAQPSFDSMEFQTLREHNDTTATNIPTPYM